MVAFPPPSTHLLMGVAVWYRHILKYSYNGLYLEHYLKSWIDLENLQLISVYRASKYFF